MAKKTLADEIANFYKPKNDYDIEDFDSGRSQKDLFQHNDEEDDEELNSENEVSDEELKNQHYVESSKSKLRDQQNLNLGEKYTGDVISRDQLYDESGDEEESEEEELEEEHEDDDDEEQEEEPEIEDESADDEEEDLDSKLSQESQDEESEEDFDEPTKSLSSHKNNIVKQLLAKEKTHIINRLSQSTVNDVLKGYSVQQQYKTYEKLVELRIKFQKSITSINQLPINSKTYYENKSKDSDELLEDAKFQTLELLKNILILRSKLEKTTIKQPKKRTYEAYSKTTESADSNLNAQRALVLNKWSSKIQNSSGNSAINNNKFKSINQSFEQQVKNNLSDIDRLVKRTKLNRRQVTPLGYSDEAPTNEEEQNNDDIPQENNIRKKSHGQENQFIFDDEDFYRILLNDLVDKKIQSSESSTTSNINMIKSVQRSNKLKNNIDTKASKGRKLRYHIQDQIANFETSTGGWKWNDDQIDEFFASLLGQKVNMNEDDDADENEEVEEENIESNGIRLFG
ncbi:BFR2 [Candida jiufengensis]|uniref:BFR2 n=1 Tax=Candida jiufengensis TaxID=497108 RepID=UPI002224C347|nr:BFR2 [Candida jiufengensis]KAI5957307.1 BFR2 [Candida jiufengensis]